MIDKKILRKIFLNLFTITFITITYFYLSESFGSISSKYINNSGYVLQFSISLLLFTFLAVLAGPIIGLASGFIGELLIQLAFYNVIYFDWCLLVALLGLFCGLYKYKPLKYHEGMKVYYTFLILVVTSFIVMFFIVLLQFLFHPVSLDMEGIFINFGFMFFTQALISMVLPIPILLIGYDKIFSTRERHVYNQLLTHHPISASDHTFFFQFGRTKFYFCSRCSGVIIGALISMFSIHIIELISGAHLNPEIAVILCIILPIIGMIDWGTQKLKYRKSTTESRLITGFLIGIALNLLNFTQEYYFFMLIIITIYFAALFLLIYFGYKRDMKKMTDEMDRLSDSDDIIK
ncbi:MAG: DUF2085 domain-containing protein [Promethearchaeota archaeon]